MTAVNRLSAGPVDGAMQLVDIGANLTHVSFVADLEAVLGRANDAGVVQTIVTGTSLKHTGGALALARGHPGRLFSTAGVHPHHAGELKLRDGAAALLQLFA